VTDLISVIIAELVRLVPNIGSPEQIEPDAQLSHDLGVTSMQMVLLVTTLCRRLDVPMTAFDETDLAAMTSIRSIVERFEPQLQGRAA
jgi:acyl carrier protein